MTKVFVTFIKTNYYLPQNNRISKNIILYPTLGFVSNKDILQLFWL